MKTPLDTRSRDETTDTYSPLLKRLDGGRKGHGTLRLWFKTPDVDVVVDVRLRLVDTLLDLSDRPVEVTRVYVLLLLNFTDLTLVLSDDLDPAHRLETPLVRLHTSVWDPWHVLLEWW